MIALCALWLIPGIAFAEPDEAESKLMSCAALAHYIPNQQQNQVHAEVTFLKAAAKSYRSKGDPAAAPEWLAAVFASEYAFYTELVLHKITYDRLDTLKEYQRSGCHALLKE